MASSSSPLIFSLLFFFLLFLSLSSAVPSSTILDAAEILSTSGFETMALNLELASQTLQPVTHSFTVFAPSEFAFGEIDHIPLSLLQYHLLPHAFSLQSLSSLPFGAKISTLFLNHSLTVTRSSHHHWVSLNNVTVKGSPIFDDGTLAIYGIDNFFNPQFQIENPTTTTTTTTTTVTTAANSNLRCVSKTGKNDDDEDMEGIFEEACGVLRSKGCSEMASFLELQFLGLENDRPHQFTLFAPVDEAMMMMMVKNRTAGNLKLSDYSQILRRHVVPCKIQWSDLVSLDNGTMLTSYERGFSINVMKSGDDELLLNEVGVIFPELYHNNWFVIHGIQEVLSDPKARQQEEEEEAQHSGESHSQVRTESKESSSSSKFDHYDFEEYPTTHYHFSVFH